MRSGGWKTKAGLVVLAAASCFALTWVARISSGTGYPRHSSLSSAPSGSKLLFEVLERSGRFSSVERNFLPAEQFHPVHSTVFYLGLSAYGLGKTNDSALRHYEEIAQSGNRVVLGVGTGMFRIGQYVFDTDGSGEAGEKKILEVKRWDISVHREPGEKKEDVIYRVQFGPEWRQLGASQVWERRFGDGAVWMVINPGRLSNQELAQSDTARALVPLLVSGSRGIWFEEGHLGVMETGSIAGLMRRYRMQGLVAACLLVTALVLWRNAARFPPAAADEEEGETVVVGSDAHRMLVELLSRHVAGAQLMDVCVAEWNRVEPRRRLEAERWRGRDPVAAYREIAAELEPRRVRKA